jgi:HlyD family secretion protein
VELARAEVAQVQAIFEIASRSNSKGLELGIEDLARRRNYLDESIAIANDRIAQLEKKVASLEQLLARGLIGRDTLIAAENELNDARQAKVGFADERKELDTRELDLRSGKLTAQQQATLQLTDARNRLAALELQLRASSEVTSPFDGTITTVLATAGAVVGPGTALVQLEAPDRELNAVLYVSQVDGKKVLPGMKVHLSPANVREEEYGFMLATVTGVSDFPSPPQRMMSLLQNTDLVRTFSADGSPYEVSVSLERNPATRSGFRWSSRRDPPFTITSGTLCSGSVVVAEHRPIALVVPLLRKETGL